MPRPPLLLLLGLAVLAGCGRLSGGGGGGSGAPGVVELPPVDEQPVVAAPTLLSALGDAGAVHLQWTAPEQGADGPALLLFGGALPPSEAYQGAPLASGLTGTALTLEGLPDGVPHAFGLALDEESGPRPVGEVLVAVPGAPLYVDPAADPTVADGLTPATAFPSPLSAFLTALLAGGGNVWLAEGVYPPASLPVFEGLHVAGGFAAGFDPAQRDPAQHVTRLRGGAGQPILSLQQGGALAVLDGLLLDGGGVASSAVLATDAPLALRRVEARACAGAGLRLRAGEQGDPVPASLLEVTSRDHGGEGLSVKGALEVRLSRCRLLGNQQEGADFDDLVAPDGRTVRLLLADSLFAANGSEGLDVDLGAPLLGGLTGGRTEVTIERCRFELNGSDGALLDVDFELLPGWSAHLLLRGVTARGNGGAGLHLDLDGDAPALVHRALSSANGGDGLLVTSEIHPALVLVSSSAFAGNGGVGLRAADGNGTVLLTHGLLAGNQGGGVASEVVRAVVTSSLAWLQPAPWSGATVHHGLAVDDPLASPMARQPVLYAPISGWSGDTVELAPSATPPAAGQLLEVADDGVPRSLAGFAAGSGVLVAPAPEFVPLPSVLAAFAGPGPVSEDYTLLPGSAAQGAGMAPPGGLAADAGVLGAPGSGRPGVEDASVAPLFRLAHVEPGPAAGVPDGAPLRLVFADGLPDPGSVGAASVRALGPDGAPLPVDSMVEEGVLLVLPPAGGWPPGSLLELHEGLRSTDGLPLALPLALPVEPAP